jgi:hypothetical protein
MEEVEKFTSFEDMKNSHNSNLNPLLSQSKHSNFEKVIKKSRRLN